MSKAHRAIHAPLFLQALEPRVLLDAAAAQTALDVAQQSDAAPPPSNAPSGHADLVAALRTLDGDNPPADAADAHDDSQAPPAPTAVYFIDRGVADPELLARSLPPGAEFHFIDAGTDGVAYIAQTLDGRSEVGAIHILSHGDAGALQLGNVALTLQSMQGTHRDELQAIGRALGADADILIYGCDFAQGEAGAQAARTLSALTGADVAASTDDTGAASLGGDWDLEQQIGAIEAAAVQAGNWLNLLTAPVLDSTPALTYMAAEDGTAPANGTPAGVPVSTYTVGITDVDPGAVKGIAITANAPSQGVWWYTTDAGATWTQVGTVSNNSALLLADNASTRLYFQATTANFNGNVTGTPLTFKAWDQGSGSAGTKADPAAGSVSVTTDTIAVTVTPVNDAPVLTDQPRTFNAIYEDNNSTSAFAAPTGAVGTTLNTGTLYLSSGYLTDVDTGASQGMAVIGADSAHGTWWYSIDNGSTWLQLGSVSDTNALLLSYSGSSRIYFQPAGDFNGTATLTIRGWDQSTGSNGARANASMNGGTTAFSSATDTVAITVHAIADIRADTLNGANSAQEDTAKVFNPIAGTGGATADSFEGTNPQITAIAGQAIQPGGSVTLPNGTVSLGADGQTLTFLGAADFNGNATFSYTVSSGSATETANISITVAAVADAPRIDLNTTTTGSFIVLIDDGQGGTVQSTVSVLVTPVQDAPAFVDPGQPGQDFDPSTGDIDITTRQNTPVAGRVQAVDPDGDTLTYQLGTPPSDGSVQLLPGGGYTYTPGPNFTGVDSFVVYVDDGQGNRVAATVRVTTLAASTNRQDYPIVFRPVEPRDEASAPQAESRTIDARPVVLDVVDAFGSLQGTAALDPAQGVVLQAVNGVDSLNTLSAFGAKGVVLDVVGAVDSLGSIDSPKPPPRAGAWQGPARASITDRPVVPSLVLADQRMRLEMEAKDAQVWLFVSAPQQVQGLNATLANGRPLPGWARLAPGGALVMDRPADVDRLRVRIGLELEEGKFRSREVEIDFNAGQLRMIDPSGNRPAPPGAERGDPTRDRGRALTFGEQLSQATVPSDADAQLLELLS